jgi:hypothetical protein
METIKFSFNWNKKLETDIFTTIRLENPNKYRQGEQYLLRLEERGRLIDRGICEIIEITTIKLFQLKPYAAYLDTGYNLDATKDIIYKMYPATDWQKQNLYYMLIRKVKQTNEMPKLF